MIERPLDLDAVQAFVRIAELGSFTRAAEAAQTTQSAVSLKLKRLEERLGCRLVERTPRHVQLSTRGAAFPRSRPRTLGGTRPRVRRICRSPAAPHHWHQRPRCGPGAPRADRAHECARLAAVDRNPDRILWRPASKLRSAGTRRGDCPPGCWTERRRNSYRRKIRLVRSAKLATSCGRVFAGCHDARALRRACDGRTDSR